MRLRNVIISIGFAALLTACGDGVNKAPVGEACEEVEDCDSSLCVQSLTSCHPIFGCSTYELSGGMCSNECTWLDEGTEEEKLQADCGEGEQCLSYGFSESVCFVGCEEDADCRSDYVCTALDGFSTCLPPEEAARVVQDDLRIYANPALELAR